MIDVYFVRHGETEHNKGHLHQPGTTQLNERGREQATKAARIIRPLAPDSMITSTLTRTEQTARIIGDALGLQPERNVLYVELTRPDYVVGLTHFSFTSILYIFRWFFSNDASYWKKCGGESRADFLLRIQEAKRYLEELPDNTKVLVVSHSIFINFFVEHICNEKPIGLIRAALLLLKIKTLDNSSLTHVIFDKNAAEGTCKWNLVSFDEDGNVTA